MATGVHFTVLMSVPYGKILVVEDDEVERESLAELLRLWDYEVSAASDGWQALHELASSAFDLVLSDVHMRYMGGIALLRELRRNFHRVSCIIISGEENDLEESEAMRLGARGFLKKPINPEDLKTVLRQCLSVRRDGESGCEWLVPHRASYGTGGSQRDNAPARYMEEKLRSESGHSTVQRLVTDIRNEGGK